MARTIVYILVIAAIGWSVYIGYFLLSNTTDRFAPHAVFSENDGGVLRINNLQEVVSESFKELVPQNIFFEELTNINTKAIGRLTFYCSANSNLLLIERKSRWTKSEIEAIRNTITLAGVTIDFDGRHVILTKEHQVHLKTNSAQLFQDADKKATANYWVPSENGWKRTDIYALERGYFEYRSAQKTMKAGKAAADAIEFSNVLPQEIQEYTFYERFYRNESDTNFHNSPLSEWIDKGFVLARIKDELFLVTDYRTSEPPAIVLANYFRKEIEGSRQIKMYQSMPLLDEFPLENDTLIYLLELEDKVIFTRSLQTAIQIELRYQMGETLALNPQRFNQLFADLPQHSNYRFVSKELKQSITLRNELEFMVNTKPPGEKLIQSTSGNWTNSALPLITGITPISDHLRGGNSVFIYNEQGQYALITSHGQVAWKGSVSGTIKTEPLVVDIFENNKKQLLFHTENKIHLIDLNGSSVGNFPYTSDHSITTDIHPFKWKNTIRFLLGTHKGELIVLNNSGNELNIIQAGNQPLEKAVFALNMGGNLRGWAINTEKEILLTYLETPAKAESKGKSTAIEFQKNAGEIIGLESKNEQTFIHYFNNQPERPLGRGNLQSHGQYIVLKDQNKISVFNTDYSLRWMIQLPFNEIGSIQPIVIQQKNYLFVTDYLKNKIHLLDENGQNISGFPKDGSELISYAFDSTSKTLSIYSSISGSLICYTLQF